MYNMLLSLKGMHVRVRGDISLPSPSAPCLFVGEYTEEGLARPLTPSLLSPFMNCRDYSGRILVVLTKGQNMSKSSMTNLMFSSEVLM